MSLYPLELIDALQQFDTKAQEMISKMTPALLAQVVRFARERESAEVLTALKEGVSGGDGYTALEMLGHLHDYTREVTRQRDAHENTIASLTFRLQQVGAALEGWGLSGNEVEKVSRIQHEVRAVIVCMGKDATQVREGAGSENLLASLAVSVNALRHERDTLRKRVDVMWAEHNARPTYEQVRNAIRSESASRGWDGELAEALVGSLVARLLQGQVEQS